MFENNVELLKSGTCVPEATAGIDNCTTVSVSEIKNMEISGKNGGTSIPIAY
jgi:hypothetical protein